MDSLSISAGLAEPTRLVVAQLRYGDGEHCVCEITRKLDATQSRMTHLLQVLGQTLVADRRDARRMRYWLNSEIGPATRTLAEAPFHLAKVRNAERTAA